MISPTVIFKVALFSLLTFAGCSYAAVQYLGVGVGLFTEQYDVVVDLEDSGGIFTNAEVTYRGITVGRVGPIEIRDRGIRATLKLETDEKIPARTRAVVANGSAVGEQFVDLQPSTPDGPYLEAGSVIPASQTELPVPTTELLTELSELARSVPLNDLTTVVKEAGAAFEGRAEDLQRLIDSTGLLVAEAQGALPATERLLADAEIALATQQVEGGNFGDFSRDLALLSQALVDSDADIRTVLQDAGPAAAELRRAVDDVRPPLTAALDDLVGVSEVMSQRSNNLRQLLIYYPYLVAGSLTAWPGNDTVVFGVPINQAGAPQCREGYMPTSEWLDPSFTGTRPYPEDSFCKAPPESGLTVRGTRNAPTGGAVSNPPPAGDGGAQRGAVEPASLSTGPVQTGAALGRTKATPRMIQGGSWTRLLTAPHDAS